MKHALEKRQLFTFFALSYGMAWLFFLPLGLSRIGLGWIPLNLSIPLMTVLGTFAPTMSAIVTLRVTNHRWPRRRFISNPLRWAFALLLCPFLVGLTFAALPAICLVKGSAASLHWSALLSFSFFNYSTLIGGPLGEEPGWRGFALPRLENIMAPWKASLLLGFLWAGWHLPLFLTSSWSSSSVSHYFLIVAGLSILMTFLFNFSNQSVIVAIFGHAMFNTASRWLTALLGDVPLREGLNPELVLGLCGLFAGAVLIVLTRGRLSISRQQAP